MKFIKQTKEKHKKRLENKKKINKAKDKKNVIQKLFFIVILILLYLFYPKNITLNNLFYNKNKKRIGVICIDNSYNVGNILVKYSIFKKLEELGINTTIITPGKFRKN